MTQAPDQWEAVRARLSAELAEAEARVAKLRGQIDGLNTIQSSFPELLELFASAAATAGVVRAGAVGSATMQSVSSFGGRVTPVDEHDRPAGRHHLAWETIVEHSLHEFHTKAITRHLNAAGYDLPNVKVSNALSTLARLGRITSTPERGKGFWRVTDQWLPTLKDSNGTDTSSVPLPTLSSPVTTEAATG